MSARHAQTLKYSVTAGLLACLGLIFLWECSAPLGTRLAAMQCVHYWKESGFPPFPRTATVTGVRKQDLIRTTAFMRISFRTEQEFQDYMEGVIANPSRRDTMQSVDVGFSTGLVPGDREWFAPFYSENLPTAKLWVGRLNASMAFRDETNEVFVMFGKD